MMIDKGVAQAAETLRIYLASLCSPHRDAELSTFANLIYQDRLNSPPLDQSDPAAAIDEACQRFSDIIMDHLALETFLLAMIARSTGDPLDQALKRLTDSGFPD
jgi:hypothetical protein